MHASLAHNKVSRSGKFGVRSGVLYICAFPRKSARALDTVETLHVRMDRRTNLDLFQASCK